MIECLNFFKTDQTKMQNKTLNKDRKSLKLWLKIKIYIQGSLQVMCEIFLVNVKIKKKLIFFINAYYGHKLKLNTFLIFSSGFSSF